MRYLLVITVLMCSGCANLARGLTAAGNVPLQTNDVEQSKTIYQGGQIVGRTQGNQIFYRDGSIGDVR